MLKLYKYADYDVAIAVLEASSLENEDLESRLSLASKIGKTERKIFIEEYMYRSKYMVD